jgi:pimeloyl-ACP methyl ester carboxylesterase
MLDVRMLAVSLFVALPQCSPGLVGDERGEAHAVVDHDTPEVRPSSASRGGISVDEIAVPGDLPAFVLNGARGNARMVFLHGMCGHGQGYVQAFQGAAAEHGTTIAMMGDTACGANPAFRTWTLDIARIDARIEAAFAAAGQPLAEGDEVVLIGMSQGAMRAESLLGRFPARYRRAVFMGAPRWPDPARVGKLERAVLMAGEFEGTWAPKQAALALERRKVAALFVPIPKSNHAELRDGEATMRTALDFVFGGTTGPRAVR